jgi:hypothetical protein
MSDYKLTAREKRDLERAKDKIEKYAMVAMQGILSNPKFRKGLNPAPCDGEFFGSDGKIMDYQTAVALEAVDQAHSLHICLNRFFCERPLDMIDSIEQGDSSGEYDYES